MATKRIKPDPVKTKAEALKIIDDIARLEIARQAKEAKMKEDILEIQEGVGKEVEQLQEKITLLMDRVEGYILAHQAELFKPGQREGETAIATFGARLGNPTVGKARKWTWDELADEVAGKEKLKTFARVKNTVDKEAILKAWREKDEKFGQLGAYGVKIVQSEVAWVEPKADGVVE